MSDSSVVQEREVIIDTGEVRLEGNLAVPQGAEGLVIFAHGSGSSRFSPRNRFVARKLQKVGLATLLFDLLTSEEEAVDIYTREYRFNISLLAHRVIGATQWVLQQPGLSALNMGYFGASTGAAAALIAAASLPDVARAVVSRGGRPDLAGDALLKVYAPTLFIVGERDTIVLKLNQEALALIPAPEKQLVIVPGASHLFEEPGALEEVARLAAAWFTRYLTSQAFEAKRIG